MQVGFNPSLKQPGVSFRPAFKEGDTQPAVIDMPAEEKPKTAEERPKTTFKERIASIAKFFGAAGQITKGIIKAAFYGTLAFGAAIAGAWTFRQAPEGVSRFKEPMKVVGRKGKIIAGVASGLVAVYHVTKGFLKANNKKASIDHHLATGHNRK
jgi:hypothetical protein